MYPAPLPANEAARLQSLHELQALDTEPEAQFDALVKVASLVCGVPISLISLIDADRQWFKANVGLPGVDEAPRDLAFCAHAILGETIFEVGDAMLDPRFSDSPLVTAAPHIRFYAGAPVRLSSGECVGTLCVIDRQPRQLDAQQRDILTQLAFVAASALEGRRALASEHRLLQEQAQVTALLRESQALLDRTGRMAGVGGWSIDLASKAVTCSDETCRIYGVEPGYQLTIEEGIGFYAPEARPVIQAAVEKCIATGQGWELELPFIQADGRHIWTRSVGAIDLSGGVPVRLVGALQDVTDSRAQRLAVVQAKERIEAATQSGEIGIWDLDLMSGALTWDARMYQFYGLTPIEETAAYTLWTRHLHPEDRASAEQAFQDALSGLRPLDSRFRIVWSDGTVRHLRATGRVTLRDDQGHALRIVGVNWDVSKVRKLSLELERKEQMLRSVTDSLPMLVSYIDIEQRYRFANPTYAAWFGVPIENIVGSRVADILGASAWAKAAPHLQAALQGTASVYENQLRVLGQQRDLRAQFMPQWDEHGQVEGVVGVVSDISDYKANEQLLTQAVAQATETLRQEEARWRDFSTIASDWFWETDAQHFYRFISENVEQYYGLPASELVGRNLKSLLENDSLNAPELMAQHVLKLEGRQPWRQFEYQVRVADGSLRWISMSASPQFDPQGRFTGYRGNGSCITDRKNAEKNTAILVDEISTLNQRFTLAKDAARIGVWDYDFADNTSTWSKWMYVHYAVREEDFGGSVEDWLAGIHPGDAARLEAEFAQAVRGEKDLDTEFRVVWPSGEVRHLKSAALVQRDDSGAPLKMVGVNYDITAIRLAEQAALRDQELDLATVQRIGRIGTFVANLETEMWTSSSVLDDIYGIDANFERSRKNLVNLIAPEFTQVIDDYFLQVVSEKGSFDKEYEIVRPADGQRRWLHVMGEVTFDAEGKPLRFKGTVQDITERKRAQAQLTLLQTSISHLNDMVVITEAEPLDEPGPRIVFVNAAFERQTGYSSAEVLGRSPRFLQGPLTQRLELDRICVALRAWQPVRAELINYTKAGQPFWVELDIVPIADATGFFTHWVSVQRDITDRKQAEKQLRAYKAFLERAEQIAGVGGWELDLLTHTLLWSDQTHRIHDVEIGVQPLVDQWIRYFASQERKIIRRTLQECIAQRKPWDLELPMTTATGRAIWIRSVGSVEIMGDRPVRLVGTLQDVTAVRAMREELHRSNTVLQSMLDNLPCGLSVYDNALRLVAHNHLYRGLLDLPEALFSGPVTHFEDVLRSGAARGEYGPGPVDEVVAQLLKGGHHSQRLLYEHQRHDGKPLEVRNAPMPGGGFVTTYMDISERKKVERLKGEFISTVSHELRTPLTAIYGSLSMLASGVAGDLAPDVNELIGLSLSSSERLVRLINDVLDVEKIESKMMTYTMVVQPLVPLIDQAIAATWHYADQFGVQIKLETRIDRVSVRVDADRIVQVVVNLLSNAAKFSERGRPVAVSMAVVGDRVRVSVVDGGQGIPEAFRAQIFERFSQADSSDRRQKGGTGLGLSICKSIVQEHGGHIDYVSTPGADTEFYFELPLAP